MKSGAGGGGGQGPHHSWIWKGKAEPCLGCSADSSRLVQMPPHPPCSANLLPRFAPSILLNLHTRSSL